MLKLIQRDSIVMKLIWIGMRLAIPKVVKKMSLHLTKTHRQILIKVCKQAVALITEVERYVERIDSNRLDNNSPAPLTSEAIN
jgi:hypothetical protein